MKTIYITLIFSLSSLASLIAGGPWPQQKGVGYFKLSEWWTVFDQHYTDRGLIDPNVTTGVFNTSIYAEYGITSRFTLVANAPILSRNYMNNLRSITTNEIIVEGDALNSFGDMDLGFKYGLSKVGSRIPIAASLILGLPTGKSSGGRDGNLQTGDGEFNQMIQIDAGTGFNLGKIPGYSSGFVGFNNRTNGFSEELRFGLELGVGLFKNKLWINAKLSVVESLKNGFTAETVTSTSVFANNTEFTSIGFEGNYYITKRLGVSAGYATALSGEIIAASPSYSIGIFYDMKN